MEILGGCIVQLSSIDSFYILILDRLRASLLGLVLHKEIWRENLHPYLFVPTNSLFCGREMTFAIRKSSCKPACGAFALEQRRSRLYVLRIVALPSFIGYWYILRGRLITWSGIVTYLCAAQRDLQGKSPPALSSPWRFEGSFLCCMAFRVSLVFYADIR